MVVSASTRSAVANGSRLFVDKLDGRSALARRHRDLTAEFIRDLGGEDALSEAQRQMVRRAAALSVWSEAQERRIISGEQGVDANQLVTAANTIRRLLRELGLAKPRAATQRAKPVARPVQPPPAPSAGTIAGYLGRSA